MTTALENEGSQRIRKWLAWIDILAENVAFPPQNGIITASMGCSFRQAFLNLMFFPRQALKSVAGLS